MDEDAPRGGSMYIKKTGIPKLELGPVKEDPKKDESRPGRGETDANTGKEKRELSDSSRGSIGRKERLRNALTGRSDGSGDGADKPSELP